MNGSVGIAMKTETTVVIGKETQRKLLMTGMVMEGDKADAGIVKEMVAEETDHGKETPLQRRTTGMAGMVADQEDVEIAKGATKVRGRETLLLLQRMTGMAAVTVGTVEDNDADFATVGQNATTSKPLMTGTAAMKAEEMAKIAVECAKVTAAMTGFMFSNDSQTMVITDDTVVEAEGTVVNADFI